jgi:hypothetical protein
MFFKEQGWEDPRRCVPCRKIHKAEFAEKMAARLAAKRAKPASTTAPVTEGINPAELIAAASTMVDGDGSWNVV